MKANISKMTSNINSQIKAILRSAGMTEGKDLVKISNDIQKHDSTIEVIESIV